jgi:hypothetical protein
MACRHGAAGTACAPVASPAAAAGEPCTFGNQCEAGTACLDFGAGFHCERYCPNGSIGFCGASSVCNGTIGDVCVRLCRPLPTPCDIYAQDCAGAGETCTLVRNGETDFPYTGCRPAGTRLRFESCGAAGEVCAFDLICIRAGTASTCHEPCDPMAAPDTCPAGETCTGFARTWMVGYCEPAP